MSNTRKAIRILVYMNAAIWLTLFIFVYANSAHAQVVPDAEYIQVTQVWLPIVRGGE